MAGRAGTRLIGILRVLLGLVVAVQALSSLFPLAGTVSYKLGLAHPRSGRMARMIPIWEATPWWAIAVWSVGILVLAVTAWRVARGQKAALLYAIGVATSLALTWLMQQGEAYRRMFPVTTRFDYDRIAVLVLVGALIWWMEQRPASATRVR